MQGKLPLVRDQIDAARAKRASLEADVARLKAESTRFQNSRTGAEAAAREAEALRQANEKKLADVQGKLPLVSGQVEAARAKRAILEADAEQLEGEITHLRNSRIEADAAAREADTLRLKKAEELDKAQSELSVVLVQIAAERAKLDKLQTEIKRFELDRERHQKSNAEPTAEPIKK